MLKKLQHKNIIECYDHWEDKEKKQVNFITELMTSGTLKRSDCACMCACVAVCGSFHSQKKTSSNEIVANTHSPETVMMMMMMSTDLCLRVKQ